MKKIFKFLPFILGLTLASCGVNELDSDLKPIEGPTMKVNFTTEEAKTAMVPGEGSNYTSKWTAGDQLGVFVRANGGYVNQNIATEALLNDTQIAVFNATVSSPAEDATYEFYTYYPYSNLTNNDYRKVRVSVPVEQYPANGSFDPKADILSGYPIDVPVTAGQTELTGLSLQFVRKSSIVHFVIPSCQDFDGINAETPVSEVTVYFDKNVAGVANWSVVNNADLVLEDVNASKSVTLKYTSEHKIKDDLWLSIAPVQGVKSLTFAFKVADNAYLYAEASLGAGVDFVAGGMKKYSIPISGTKWELKSYQVKYQKVTSTPADWLGKYLIVGENGGNLYACNQVSTGDWGTCSLVEDEDDGSILSTPTIDGYAFNVIPGIADDTYAFKFANGQFVSSGAAKKFNALDEADADKTDFTLAISDDFVKVASNTSTNRQLRYNHNSGSGGLRFYDGTTGVGVSLYKRVEDYSVIVPVIADPVGIPETIGKAGLVNAQFTVDIALLGKNTVSIKSFDGTVVTAASVVYANNVATVTYSVAANTDVDRHGSIVIKAGTSEKEIDLYQESGVSLPEIDPVSDQEITYEASDSHTFDVTIRNIGGNEISCEVDGEIVVGASAALKSGDVYTVTYTVTANSGMESRTGTVTVKCSTVSQSVNINQDYNHSAVKTYNRVASLSDIVPGRYVIVASTSTITAYLPNSFNTSSAPTAVKTGFTCTESVFKTTDDSEMAWDFTGTTSAMTIKSAADAENYLYNIANNNGTRVGTTSDTWIIAKHASNTANNLFQFKDVNNNRFVGIYNNTDWRSYSTYNASNYTAATGSSKIKLYILDDGKTNPTVTTTDKTINTNESQDVSQMFSSNSDGEISYSVSGGTLTGTTFTATTAGTYTVTFTQAATQTYRQAVANATITVTEPVWTLQSITITTPPTKTSYEAGETFSPEGMVVTGNFTDEKSFAKSWAVSGYTYPTEPLVEGTTTALISYTYNSVTKTANQGITVTGATTVWVLNSIAVTTAPTKTSYKVGENLDLSGMVVTGTYSDQAGIKPDKQETVSGWSSNPADGSELSTVGDVTVTISYEGKQTSTTVSVENPSAKTWTYEVSSASPVFNSSAAITVNKATWSIAMGTIVGSPSANGTISTYSNTKGWKWGDSSSKYWKTYTLSTDYFTTKKVKSVTVNFLNNGNKAGTMTVKQGTTTIGSQTKTFGQTWTDLTANTTQGASGTLTIEYSVAQASCIHSITVEYLD